MQRPRAAPLGSPPSDRGRFWGGRLSEGCVEATRATDPVTVLVIEDELQGRTLLNFTLRQQGYRCLQASNGAEGIAAAFELEPTVVLLDLGLSDLDGREVTRRIRARSNVPIIVVSARGQEQTKVAALDEGANDFITKPFAAGELLDRVQLALRNLQGAEHSPENGVVEIGELKVNFDLRRVTVRGTEVHLTPTEYRLLSLFVRSAGRVLSSRQILRQVWGTTYQDQMGYLRVYVKKLRFKIEAEPTQPKYLINEPGVGYRLRLPD